MSRHFLGPDPLIEPRAFRRSADEGEHTHVGEVNSIPTTVGGGGTHADGKVPRFREEDFRLLSTYGPQDGAARRRLAARLRRARAVLRRGRAGHRRRRPGRGQSLRRLAVGPLPHAAGCADVRRRAVVGRGREGRAPSLRGADRGQQHRLRRAAGLQQLRLLRLLRLPHPRQGRPGRAADQGHGHRSGRADGRDLRVSRIVTEGRPGHRGRVHRSRRGGAHRWTPSWSSWPGAPSRRRACSCSRGWSTRRSARHLMVHFQTIVVGHFPDLRLHPHKGRSVTHVHDDAMVQDDALPRGGAGAGLPWIRGGLVEHSGGRAAHHGGAPLAVGTPPRAGHARLEPARAHVGLHHAGRGPALPHQHGRPEPVDPRRPGLPGGPRDLPARPPRAGGVEAPREDPPVGASRRWGPSGCCTPRRPGVSYHGVGATPIPESRHVIGTARMGDDPATSVVDRWGRVHALDNVVDGRLVGRSSRRAATGRP